ncbi:hypothetical protein M5K25_011730 [Dendrobium thyrsiflorum]|uniref:Uncharacterized protein n=1 Tax=Dendrobium thyrsiflorum TaxID=117978 RepID=A0ABD0V3U1_DENTH
MKHVKFENRRLPLRWQGLQPLRRWQSSECLIGRDEDGDPRPMLVILELLYDSRRFQHRRRHVEVPTVEKHLSDVKRRRRARLRCGEIEPVGH